MNRIRTCTFASLLLLSNFLETTQAFVNSPCPALVNRSPSSSSSAVHVAPVEVLQSLTDTFQTSLLPTLTTALQPAVQSLQQSPLQQFLYAPPWLASAWEQYNILLKDDPIITKAVTAAILSFTGDAVAQVRSTEDYSIRRGLAFLVFGALYTGAFQHHWFNFMTNNIQDWGEDLHVWGHPAVTDIPVTYFMETTEWWEYFDLKHQITQVMDTLQDPPSPVELAAAKLALNQGLMIPVIYMPLYFGVTGAVAGLDFNKIVARAQSLYFPLLLRNYLFWIPLQFLQFLVVPQDLQVPFVCVASLCWTVILSSIGGSPAHHTESQVVVYEEVQEAVGSVIPITYTSISTVSEEEEPILMVIPVDAGATNDLIDDVLWEEVRDSFVPKPIQNTVGDVVTSTNPQVAGGLALGLLAAAADEAAIGAAVGSIWGGTESLGVALVAAVGAGVGYLVSQQHENKKDEDEIIINVHANITDIEVTKPNTVAVLPGKKEYATESEQNHHHDEDLLEKTTSSEMQNNHEKAESDVFSTSSRR